MRFNIVRSRFAVVIAAALLALCGAAAADNATDDLRVDRLEFPVTLASGAQLTVVGWLHHRGSATRNTVQLVVHGAGFDHQYWDVPDIDGHAYSYARYMSMQNYAVLAIDLPGTGQSTHPDGDSFGLPESAECVHQVASALRRDYDRVVLVGFSNGSVTSIYAQGTYHDADALVTTGWVHGCRGLPIDPTDPVLGAALAFPYVTLPEFARIGLLFYLPSVDPAVLDYDATTLAQAVPRRQLLDLLGVHFDITQRCADGSSTTLTRSQSVTGPVLVQAGEKDLLIAPASIINNPPTERSFYPSASSVTIQVLGATGHAFNLHTTNLDGWARIDAWLRSTL
jgi:pimeloyl-ACP methyl ester carboxylesterase